MRHSHCKDFELRNTKSRQAALQIKAVKILKRSKSSSSLFSEEETWHSGISSLTRLSQDVHSNDSMNNQDTVYNSNGTCNDSPDATTPPSHASSDYSSSVSKNIITVSSSKLIILFTNQQNAIPLYQSVLTWISVGL